MINELKPYIINIIIHMSFTIHANEEITYKTGISIWDTIITYESVIEDKLMELYDRKY